MASARGQIRDGRRRRYPVFFTTLDFHPFFCDCCRQFGNVPGRFDRETLYEKREMMSFKRIIVQREIMTLVTKLVKVEDVLGDAEVLEMLSLTEREMMCHRHTILSGLVYMLLHFSLVLKNDTETLGRWLSSGRRRYSRLLDSFISETTDIRADLVRSAVELADLHLHNWYAGEDSGYSIVPRIVRSFTESSR